MSAAGAEKAINQLRKLPANKVCGTCPYEERMGFKNVCMKFKIFICDDCKSAHQAFSHRCKVHAARRRRLRVRRPRAQPSALLPPPQSVTMSNWTMAEVDILRHENGGGNANNNAKIFAKLPPDFRRPQKGCHPDDLKEFIQVRPSPCRP